ncbi:5-methylcytosine-specific restriction enzyme subunit McrC [Sinorhizobium kostiense]|uniref:5-methylcytosine-specific restriction enzyme subunit McrC n=1 Tax=Sinorhizobium kostiense TaxID=76747 RepID=A0ABS4R715_9HYPH|nr:5-methylcytosine-specific restriction enzyme subunit McrC [Sinorhizobium kostiense]
MLFEMNTLFEEYIARMLKRALASDDLRVVSQGGRLYCLETEDRHGLFQTQPDILLKRGDTVVQVIDTKWKRITSRINDPKQGISQADIYQMMAYGRLYRCGHLTLLYPHHGDLLGDDGVLATNVITGSDDRLETATIDVGRAGDMASRLRRLVHCACS